jgi:DNA processing protein
MTNACATCLRRGWLLAELSPMLDYRAQDPGALLQLLALGDRELLQALGGRRRADLIDRHTRFDAAALRSAPGIETLCRHSARYPGALDGELAPRALHLAGSARRLSDLSARPTVAIVGSTRPTDYGIEIAKSLARGLAVSGVTVVSALAEGIGAAAADGALEVRAAAVVIMSGGVDVVPARMRSLHERIRRDGCAAAELPCGSPSRRWGSTASVRVVASLAALTVVVEAEDTSQALTGSHVARQLGRAVAAVPGRVTSTASEGTHALLIGGASLIRGPEDVLELLFESGAPAPRSATPSGASGAPEALEPGLRATLELVGAGCDTPERLIGAACGEADAVLMALTELELMGLVARGDGGRYVPRDELRLGARALPWERQMES